ncbi:hypothetical protein ACFBBF_004380, partial [Escherichia coli]
MYFSKETLATNSRLGGHWSELWANRNMWNLQNDSIIAATVLNSLINTFVQMGVEWVKSAIMGQTATTAAVAASTTAQAA